MASRRPGRSKFAQKRPNFIDHLPEKNRDTQIISTEIQNNRKYMPSNYFSSYFIFCGGKVLP